MNQTKKMTRIFLLLIAGIFFSCSSSDKPEENSFATDIIGSWELVSATSNGEEFVENPNCLDKLTFTKTTVKYLEYYDFNDGKGCVIVSGQMIDETSPYTLYGDNLSWTYYEPFSYKIIELNETTLKLQEVYTENGITYTDIETYNRL